MYKLHDENNKHTTISTNNKSDNTKFHEQKFAFNKFHEQI